MLLGAARSAPLLGVPLKLTRHGELLPDPSTPQAVATAAPPCSQGPDTAADPHAGGTAACMLLPAAWLVGLPMPARWLGSENACVMVEVLLLLPAMPGAVEGRGEEPAAWQTSMQAGIRHSAMNRMNVAALQLRACADNDTGTKCYNLSTKAHHPY